MNSYNMIYTHNVISSLRRDNYCVHKITNSYVVKKNKLLS